MSRDTALFLCALSDILDMLRKKIHITAVNKAAEAFKHHSLADSIPFCSLWQLLIMGTDRKEQIKYIEIQIESLGGAL